MSARLEVMWATLSWAMAMALPLRSRNCPRENPPAEVASLLGGLAWEGEGWGPGDRGLGTDGALLGLGALGGARRLVLGASTGGSAETGGPMACEREEAASLESFRVQAVHIHCVGCILLVRRWASWPGEMWCPHIEQRGGGGGAFAGGPGQGLAGGRGGTKRTDKGRLGSLFSVALDGGWESVWCRRAPHLYCGALGCVPLGGSPLALSVEDVGRWRAIGAGGVVTSCGLVVALVV